MKREQGSIMIMVIAVMVVAVGVTLAVVSLMTGTRKLLDLTEVKIEAEALAADLVEVGKYLLLYERVFYLDQNGPLDHRGKRGTDLLDIWQRGIGASGEVGLNLMEVCGGFDAKGNAIGRYNINGLPVYCPMYLRSNLIDGAMLEQLIFQPMLGKVPSFSEVGPGLYEMAIPFYDRQKRINNIEDPEANFLRLNMGQRLLKMAETRLEKVYLNFRFMTDSSGLATETATRYFEVSSIVETAGSVLTTKMVKRQSLVLHPATPRDFALFVMYPTRSDGNTPTRLWSQAVQIPATSQIYGRVYFNGDIDVPLQNLPTFHEVVVISGKVPNAFLSDVAGMRNKFRKGLIANMSAARYFQTGRCSATNPNLSITNSGNFNCENSLGAKVGINEYIDYTNSKCKNAPVTLSNGTMKVDCSKEDTTCPLDCVSDPSGVLSWPARVVTVNGVYGIFSAPMGVLRSNANYLYGTLFVGHLQSSRAAIIKAISNIQLGDPGFGSKDVLQSTNQILGQALEGVSAPLANLPIVYQAGGAR